VYQEQVRLVYNQGTVLVVGAFLCGIIVSAFLWTQLPRTTLGIWIGVLCIIAVLRLLVIRAYFQSDEEERQAPFFAGMVAVSSASGGVYFPVFTSFSLPLAIPLGIAHLLSSNDALWLTGVLLLMFVGVNTFLALRGNRNTRELIMARFENQALMEKLAEEKQIAERAVVAKSRFLAAASHDLIVKGSILSTTSINRPKR